MVKVKQIVGVSVMSNTFDKTFTEPKAIEVLEQLIKDTKSEITDLGIPAQLVEAKTEVMIEEYEEIKCKKDRMSQSMLIAGNIGALAELGFISSDGIQREYLETLEDDDWN